MISINYLGRLGNNLIQYFAGRVLAEKNNLYFNTSAYHLNDWGSFFNIASPKNCYLKGDQIFEINDTNFLDLLNSTNLPTRHYILNGYFQTKDFLHNYADNIKNTLNIKYQTVDPKQVFITYRIGDLNGLRQMLPHEYYEEALDGLDFQGGYITSDSIQHPFVKKIINKYNIQPITFDNPLENINFAKNFDQLVLSEGTFSWWIGFLSKANHIITNHRSFNWFGSDIFDFPHWKKLYWDYDTKFIDSNNRILKYTPVNNKNDNRL